MSEWDMSSLVDPEYPPPEFPFDDDPQVQCFSYAKIRHSTVDVPQGPQGLFFWSVTGIPIWCRNQVQQNDGFVHKGGLNTTAPKRRKAQRTGAKR